MPECGSKTSTVPVLWATFGFFSARSKWFPVGRDYITMTRRQSNSRWSGGIAAHPVPNNFEYKNPLENSRLDFLGSGRHPPLWLSSTGPNYQRGVLLISVGAIEGHFEGKTPREFHQGGLVLAWKCPASPSTGNPEETVLPGLRVSWSPTLFSGSGPVGLLPVPRTKKKKLKVRHFSSNAEVFSAAETWLEGQTSEFF